MTNRELETRYTQMKLMWKNLVNANIGLVDENKILKEEIERLNNIINNLEIWLLEHSKVDYGCAESIVHEQLALGIAFNYLQELKGGDKE